LKGAILRASGGTDELTAIVADIIYACAKTQEVKVKSQMNKEN
jgi:hypothetical protein